MNTYYLFPFNTFHFKRSADHREGVARLSLCARGPARRSGWFRLTISSTPLPVDSVPAKSAATRSQRESAEDNSEQRYKGCVTPACRRSGERR